MNKSVTQFVWRPLDWERIQPDEERCRADVYDAGLSRGRQCARMATAEIEGYGFCSLHADKVRVELGLVEAVGVLYAWTERGLLDELVSSYGDPIRTYEILQETEGAFNIKMWGSVKRIRKGFMVSGLSDMRTYFFETRVDALYAADKRLRQMEAGLREETSRLHAALNRVEGLLLDSASGREQADG